MKLKIEKNVKTFTTFLNLMSKVGLEMRMVLDANGLTSSIWGGTSTVLELKFPVDFFDEYSIEGEKEQHLILITDLVRPLKKMFSGIELESVDGRIKLTSNKDKLFIPTLEYDDGEKEIPDLQLDYTIEPTFTEFSDTIEKLKILNGEVVKFYIDDGFKMKTVNGMREMESRVCQAEPSEEAVYFSLNMFEPFLNKSDNKIKLGLQKDKPLRLDYEENGASLMVIIAPRAEGF